MLLSITLVFTKGRFDEKLTQSKLQVVNQFWHLGCVWKTTCSWQTSSLCSPCKCVATSHFNIVGFLQDKITNIWHHILRDIWYNLAHYFSSTEAGCDTAAQESLSGAQDTAIHDIVCSVNAICLSMARSGSILYVATVRETGSPGCRFSIPKIDF